MYPNLFKDTELEGKSEAASTSNTSASMSSSTMPSTISEGSLFTRELLEESKTVPNFATLHSSTSNIKVSSSSDDSILPPASTQSIKSSGMYAKRLPERLQRLQDEKCPELTVQMFFEFMRTAYQVNDSFEELAATLAANSEIDWAHLAKTDLNARTITELAREDCTSVASGCSPANSREDKSIGTKESEITKEERSPPEARDTLDDANKTEDSSSTNATRSCRAGMRKRYFQKPASPCLHLDESPSPPAESCPSNNVEGDPPPTLQKDEENPGDRSNSSPQVQSPVKKSKGPTVEAFSEHKEYLLAKIMKRKLSDILHEGLLDSILPYMLPKPAFSQPVIKKSMASVDVKKTASTGANLESRNALAAFAAKEKDREKSKHGRKSLENEVEIHVCDESKNLKKDFRCPQKLLVQKMCYFADVTAGQKLEEMDISVHCDIVIFDWLMRWVKKDIIKKSEWPILEPGNVIPILVSASFLQMEPLLESCLVYCRENMSEVLKTSAAMTCLNDNLLTRLAGLFGNVDVETLRDKKDKIQSRLFCKLIVSLVDPVPDNKRGHYSSLATLFKCGKCGKHVVRSVSDAVPCVPSAMKIDTRGELHSVHTRDLTWTLNDYIVTLRTELRSWRKVYWRLWGDCHFLFCRQCGTYFPAHRMDWCCYHPEIPQFFANEQQRSTPFPLGRYPCCSQRAYRFEVLPNREGCRFKEHQPVVTSELEVNILNIFTAHRDAIALEPPQLFFPEKITRLVARDPALPPGKLSCKEPMWWDGIELVPPRPKLGLLGKIWGGSGLRQPCQLLDSQKSSRRMRRQNSQMTEVSSPTSSAAGSDEDDAVTGCGDSDEDDESYNSEESHVWPPLKQISKFKRKSRYYAAKRSDGGRSWSASLTVRYNQDNQRDFEERAAAQMVALLTKRTSAECGLLLRPHGHSKHGHNWLQTQPLGGTYVRLEAEFREQLAQSYKSKNTVQTRGSARVKTSKVS